MKTADWLFWQSSLPHPHLPPGCFQEASPPFIPFLPLRGLKCLPPSSACSFKTKPRLGSELSSGGSAQPLVWTGTPAQSWGPLLFPQTRHRGTSLRARDWDTCCCPQGQHEELEHLTWILIQIRNLVVTRAFLSFTNIKFELKIFR